MLSLVRGSRQPSKRGVGSVKAEGWITKTPHACYRVSDSLNPTYPYRMVNESNPCQEKTLTGKDGKSRQPM